MIIKHSIFKLDRKEKGRNKVPFSKLKVTDIFILILVLIIATVYLFNIITNKNNEIDVQTSSNSVTQNTNEVDNVKNETKINIFEFFHISLFDFGVVIVCVGFLVYKKILKLKKL